MCWKASNPITQLHFLMQMTLLVTTVCLCSGKVLISVQRLWQYSTGSEMEGKMEMGGRGGGGCAEWFTLAQPSSDPALCVSIVSVAKQH